ncbi:MAG: hypothetical protein AB1465_03580 [Patescibacteria group bacterium]
MPITKSVIEAAKNLGVPVKKLGLLKNKMLLQLGRGKNIKWTRGAVTSETKYLSMKIAHHKDFANKILAGVGLPVPKHFCTDKIEEVKKFLEKTKFPIVVKPQAAQQGKIVHCDVNSKKDALLFFKKIKQKYAKVVFEEQIEGSDFRILIIGNKLVAAMQRIPPFIIGNGKSTILQLINKENKNPLRKTKKIYPIKVDEEVKRLLKQRGLNLKSILKKDEKTFLRRNANISTGGVGVDVTEIINPKNVELAIKATKAIGLDICGVDLITPDITKPYDKNGGKIIEVNGGPDAAIHHFPVSGKPRKAGEAIIKMLFPNLKK